MQLEHSFTVPVGIDDAWAVLLDIERVAPCMPGAAIDTVDGDDFTGTVKVKLGPIGLTYKGKASFVEKDAGAHVAVIHAQGRDARGNGTAAAKVTARLTSAGSDTKVDVLTDLDITGKPAQFGRGVMADVGNKLIGQFADCLASQLAGGTDPAASPDAPTNELPAAPETAAPEATTTELPIAAAAKKAAAKKAPAKKAPAAKKVAPEKKPPPAKKAPPAKKVAAASSAGTATAAVNGVAAATESAAAQSAPARPAPREVEPIDLMQSAGPAVAKRLAPVVAGIILVLILLRLLRRR